MVLTIVASEIVAIIAGFMAHAEQKIPFILLVVGWGVYIGFTGMTWLHTGLILIGSLVLMMLSMIILRKCRA